MGEVLIEEGGKGLIVPGVFYAPEVTLNILSLELLEKQGFEVGYDGNRCTLSLMFKDKKVQNFDEDRMRKMQNQYLQDYFESITKKKEGMEQDLVRIKGNLYTTKVQTFNDFVAFLNLIKHDDVVSQEWDFFRNRFNKMNYEDFCHIASVCTEQIGPKCRRFLSPSNFMKFEKDESGRIAILPFYLYVMRTVSLTQARIDMSELDEDSDGFLQDHKMEAYVPGKACIKKVLLSNCLQDLMELHQESEEEVTDTEQAECLFSLTSAQRLCG
ncbi:probable serine/threonine-protein phosphatase 2A regulatory subunit B'' subunit TON2 isoform X2 [Tanacetum coccineum]